MIEYCTKEDILQKIGVTEIEIDSNHLKSILEEAQKEVDRLLKTTCNPKTKIEIFDGNNKNIMYLRRLPLMSVKKLRISDEDISIEEIRFNEHGAVKLLNSAGKNYFISALSPNISIQYVYGWLEEEEERIIAESVESGTTQIELDDVKLLSVGDWVLIAGMDGYQEWTKIDAIDKDLKKITCDIVYPHEANSLVYKGAVPQIVRKLTGVIGGIMGSLYMIGSTYTFATSYSIPDHSVTKGVPYPHFSKNLDDLTKERDFLLKQIPEFPVFA
jgi:hypothetical protein